MRARLVAIALVLMASVSSAVPSAGQTLGLYDDFSSGPLDAARWLGYEYSISRYDSHPEALYGTPDWNAGVSDPTILASLRRVVNGQAQIAMTSYRIAGQGYAEGGAKARSGLRINHVALSDHRPVVTAFQARVTVANASIPMPDLICHPRDLGTARAELFGHFFNDGTSAGTGDLTGDVFVLVRLSRQVQSTDGEDDVLRNVVETQTGRCNNPDCSRVRWGATTTFERTWEIGVAHVLTIVWQAASDAFAVTVAGGGVTESRTVQYTFADTTPARGYVYDLRVETRPRRCYITVASDQVPHEVSIDARFDNVQLNSTAATATR
jgi:hypothetical protein